MRFLLTSAGSKNPSIHNALVDLLGKSISNTETSATGAGGPLRPRIDRSLR